MQVSTPQIVRQALEGCRSWLICSLYAYVEVPEEVVQVNESWSINGVQFPALTHELIELVRAIFWEWLTHAVPAGDYFCYFSIAHPWNGQKDILEISSFWFFMISILVSGIDNFSFKIWNSS